MDIIFHLTTVHNRYDPRILNKECVSLAKEGYAVILVVADDLPDEEYEGVKIESIWTSKCRINIKIISRIFKKIRHYKPRIIHFHDPELIPLGILTKLLFRKEIIYDVHEDYITATDTKTYPKALRLLLKRFFLFLEYLAKINFKIIIAEKYYSDRFPDSVEVLNYPIIPDYTASIQRNYRTNKLIYTGNVNVLRGSSIHADIMNYTEIYELYFIGKCPAAIYNLIRTKTVVNFKRIHFESVDKYVPFSRIQEYYAEDWLAGLALFPFSEHYYKKELTKFFKYMYQGLPVICSDFPVWKALIEENKCGICVSPLNMNEITDSIDFLYRNPEIAAVFGANGRKLVQQKYNWAFEEKKLLALYKEILL